MTAFLIGLGIGIVSGLLAPLGWEKLKTLIQGKQ